MFSHRVATSFPNGETHPKPVITTRLRIEASFGNKIEVSIIAYRPLAFTTPPS
jgi:hypothetical protein